MLGARRRRGGAVFGHAVSSRIGRVAVMAPVGVAAIQIDVPPMAGPILPHPMHEQLTFRSTMFELGSSLRCPGVLRSPAVDDASLCQHRSYTSTGLVAISTASGPSSQAHDCRAPHCLRSLARGRYAHPVPTHPDAERSVGDDLSTRARRTTAWYKVPWRQIACSPHPRANSPVSLDALDIQRRDHCLFRPTSVESRKIRVAPRVLGTMPEPTTEATDGQRWKCAER